MQGTLQVTISRDKPENEWMGMKEGVHAVGLSAGGDDWMGGFVKRVRWSLSHTAVQTRPDRIVSCRIYSDEMTSDTISH